MAKLSPPFQTCSGRHHQTKKITSILIIMVGVGKSTLGNQLIGDKKSFGVGHKFISKTERISIVADNFLGVGKCVTLIDTPGTKDTDGQHKEVLGLVL